MAKVNEDWIFSNGDHIHPGFTEKSFAILSRTTGEDDFAILTFPNTTVRSISFLATCKFIELKIGTSSLSIPKTIRGKSTDNHPNRCGGSHMDVVENQYRFDIQLPSPQTVVLKLLRLQEINTIHLHDISMDATASTETKKVQSQSPAQQPQQPVQQPHLQQQQQQQMFILIQMKQQFIGLLDSFRSDVNTRFDKLEERIDNLENTRSNST